MSLRRRTLCFIFILLPLDNDPVVIAGLPDSQVLTEFYPSSESAFQLLNSLSVSSANRVLPEIPQKISPTQRFKEVSSRGSYPKGLSINTDATSNFAIPKPNSFKTYFTSPVEMTNSMPVIEPLTESLAYPSDVGSTISENYPSATQTIHIEGFASTANIAEISQMPITVQIPSMPQLSPCIAVCSPLPETLPSQIKKRDIYTPYVVPENCLQTIDSEIMTVTSLPVETTYSIPSSSDLGCSQQLPVTLQINMAYPWIPKPVVAVVPQPAPAPSPFSSFDPSFGVPPAPIIVMEKSKSKWKRILPILILLSLFDGGCGNNGGAGCCCCERSASTPIPFPIVIPNNNPIITGGSRSRGKSKEKTSTGSDAQVKKND